MPSPAGSLARRYTVTSLVYGTIGAVSVRSIFTLSGARTCETYSTRFLDPRSPFSVAYVHETRRSEAPVIHISSLSDHLSKPFLLSAHGRHTVSSKQRLIPLAVRVQWTKRGTPLRPLPAPAPRLTRSPPPTWTDAARRRRRAHPRCRPCPPYTNSIQTCPLRVRQVTDRRWSPGRAIQPPTIKVSPSVSGFASLSSG